MEYLGLSIKNKALKPTYCTASLKFNNHSLDGNILSIIIAYQYFQKTNDIQFLKIYYKKILKVLKFLLRNEDDDGLLIEGSCNGWMDTIKKRGKVLYTNVLYYEALTNLSFLGKIMGDKKLLSFIKNKSLELGNNINKMFWNGAYYIDYIYKKEGGNFFSTDGNVLAIIFKIADKEKGVLIEDFILKNSLNKFPLKTNFPSYPLRKMALRRFVSGMAYSQNNYASWLWLGCFNTLAQFQLGLKKEALIDFEKIARTIAKHKDIYETYTPSCAPYKGPFMGPISCFAWNAGLFLMLAKRVENL